MGMKDYFLYLVGYIYKIRVNYTCKYLHNNTIYIIQNYITFRENLLIKKVI